MKGIQQTICQSPECFILQSDGYYKTGTALAQFKCIDIAHGQRDKPCYLCHECMIQAQLKYGLHDKNQDMVILPISEQEKFSIINNF